MSKEKEDKLTDLMTQILTELGEDIAGEDMKDTPRRFSKALIDMSTETKVAPKMSTFPSKSQSLVIVRGIKVRSLCRHHLFPFFGEATVAYIPNGKILGLSKFQRAMDYIAEKPQDQEKLTDEYISYIREHLDPKSIVVKITTVHTCYSSDTEVLTESGFVNVAELHNNLNKYGEHKVATYNLETNKIEYQKPINYHKRYYKGKMVEFLRSRQLVTPNHRVVYRTDWDNRVNVNNPYKVGIADTLMDSDCIIPIAGICDFTGFIPSLNRLWDEKLFAELLGIYIAEGSYSTTKGGRTYCRISQNKKNPAFARIEYLLTELGIEYRIELNRGDNYNFRITKDLELIAFFKTFGRSADRFIPDNYKYCYPEISLALVAGFYQGDGSMVKNNANYTTISYRLASDIQEVLSLNGVGCKLYKRPNAECFDVIQYIRKDGKIKPYIREYAKDINEVDYADNVYCLTVPNSTLVMRRKGKIFISGNCMSVRGVKCNNSDTTTIHHYSKDDNPMQMMQIILQQMG